LNTLVTKLAAGGVVIAASIIVPASGAFAGSPPERGRDRAVTAARFADEALDRVGDDAVMLPRDYAAVTFEVGIAEVIGNNFVAPPIMWPPSRRL